MVFLSEGSATHDFRLTLPKFYSFWCYRTILSCTYQILILVWLTLYSTFLNCFKGSKQIFSWCSSCQWYFWAFLRFLWAFKTVVKSNRSWLNVQSFLFFREWWCFLIMWSEMVLFLEGILFNKVLKLSKELENLFIGLFLMDKSSLKKVQVQMTVSWLLCWLLNIFGWAFHQETRY